MTSVSIFDQDGPSLVLAAGQGNPWSCPATAADLRRLRDLAEQMLGELANAPRP
jgi:hypothetical protein